MSGAYRDLVGVLAISNNPGRGSLGEVRGSDYVKVFDWRCSAIVISGASAIRQGLEANSEIISLKGWRDNRITHQCKIEYNGSKYEIMAIKPIGRRDLKVVITAKREVPGGN